MNERVPGDGIGGGDPAEHVLGLIELAGFGIHVHQGIAEMDVPSLCGTGHKGQEVHAVCISTFGDLSQGRTRFEDTNEGDMIRVNATLTDHVLESVDGFVWPGMPEISSNKSIPRDHVLYKHVFKGL